MANPSMQDIGSVKEIVSSERSSLRNELGNQNQDVEISRVMADMNIGSENANFPTDANLYETTCDYNNEKSKGPRCIDELDELGRQRENPEHNITEQMSNYLPEYNEMIKPASIEWGKNNNGLTISIQTSTIIDGYDEIISCKKDKFLVPYGKIGRDFIDQLTIHINQRNNKSDKQHIALKAFDVFLTVGLQKPGPKSKSKYHKDCLEKRLLLWKCRQIHKLMNEGRMI